MQVTLLQSLKFCRVTSLAYYEVITLFVKKMDIVLLLFRILSSIAKVFPHSKLIFTPLHNLLSIPIALQFISIEEPRIAYFDFDEVCST